MKNFDQNYDDIEKLVMNARRMGPSHQGFTSEALLSMNHFALTAIAAELRTIRQLMEEKAQ